MDTKPKNRYLRIIIISFITVVIVSTVISILLWTTGNEHTKTYTLGLTSDITLQEAAAPSQAAAEATSFSASFASDYDSRLPKVPVREMVTDGWPIDTTFSKKYDITLCGELEIANYKAVYIDSEKYLRVTKDGVVEVSYDKGVKWQKYETNMVSKTDFLYWLAIHEAPSMTGYSVHEMLDRLDDGAVVNHASFTDGNELYFVIDDIGVYIIPYMPNKIASVWIDGQRMAITQQVISDTMIKTFYNLLVTTGITSQDKADQDYMAKMQWLRSNDTIFRIIE